MQVHIIHIGFDQIWKVPTDIMLCQIITIHPLKKAEMQKKNSKHLEHLTSRHVFPSRNSMAWFPQLQHYSTAQEYYAHYHHAGNSNGTCPHTVLLIIVTYNKKTTSQGQLCSKEC